MLFRGWRCAQRLACGLTTYSHTGPFPCCTKLTQHPENTVLQVTLQMEAHLTKQPVWINRLLNAASQQDHIHLIAGHLFLSILYPDQCLISWWDSIPQHWH